MGPAAGKLRKGDIVLHVADRDVSDMAAIARLIAATPAGTALQVQLLRGGAEQTVAVNVGEATDDPKIGMAILGRPPAQRMAFATPLNPGMVLAALSEPVRAKFSLQPDEQGVVVTEVVQNSAAARRRIVAGELIEAVGDHSVSTPENVRQALKEITDRRRPFAPLLVRGERGLRWVPLELEADR
jgi:serine protease Do